ncbi:MAG: hypothetical protein AB7V59_18100 [Gammaproteobacteria bacterium]
MNAPAVPADPRDAAWWLWRQDDNAHSAVVARFHSRADAEEVRARFEARGHRQVYWVSAAPECRPGQDADSGVTEAVP